MRFHKGLSALLASVLLFATVEPATADDTAIRTALQQISTDYAPLLASATTYDEVRQISLERAAKMQTMAIAYAQLDHAGCDQALVLIAEEYIRHGETRSAIMAYDNCLSLCPRSPLSVTACYQAATYCNMIRDFISAEQYADKLFGARNDPELGPTVGRFLKDLYRVKATSLGQRARWNEATSVYTQLLSDAQVALTAADRASVLRERARSRIGSGDRPAAWTDYQMSFQACPDCGRQDGEVITWWREAINECFTEHSAERLQALAAVFNDPLYADQPDRGVLAATIGVDLYDNRDTRSQAWQWFDQAGVQFARWNHEQYPLFARSTVEYYKLMIKFCRAKGLVEAGQLEAARLAFLEAANEHPSVPLASSLLGFAQRIVEGKTVAGELMP